MCVWGGGEGGGAHITIGPRLRTVRRMKWVDRPTMPSTYHNWPMLENELEKKLELQGGMMGGDSIQWL